tara:strand:- start:1474 stop:2004 length:531 start_codon:yes stop_codon:yes gene_type:complete
MGSVLKVGLIMLIVIFFSSVVLAQTPNYVVDIYLKNKTIDIGQSVSYYVLVRGGGFCEDAYFTLDTEGDMDMGLKFPIIQIDTNQSIPTIVELSDTPIVTCADEEGKRVKNFSANITTSHISATLTKHFQRFGYYELSVGGDLTPIENQVGEFDITAGLRCLNNGEWYNLLILEMK